MCTCGHGSDRHFIDYAYGVGCWFGHCLEKDCDCKRFIQPAATYWFPRALQGGSGS